MLNGGGMVWGTAETVREPSTDERASCREITEKTERADMVKRTNTVERVVSVNRTVPPERVPKNE